MHRSLEAEKLVAGKYELVAKAGEGGMATVWRATMHGAAGFCRPVAVKRILPHLVSNEDFVMMFVEEARVGSQLQHPNIVQIIDFVEDDEHDFFLVMEWIEGIDLRRYLAAFKAQGQLTNWPLVTAVGIEALRGLGAAHTRLDARGEVSPVIHRDVTPQNILIGTDGIVKLTDFGLSRAMDRARMTHPDIVKGKLAYLAPEISHGADVSPQSDIFSLGVVLWESLAGRRLYTGENEIEVFLAARRAEIPPLGEIRPELPVALVKTIEHALQHDAEKRFATAHHMLRALAAILRQQPLATDAQVLSKSVFEARRVLAAAEPPAKPAPPPPPSSSVAAPPAAPPAASPPAARDVAPPPADVDDEPSLEVDVSLTSMEIEISKEIITSDELQADRHRDED